MKRELVKLEKINDYITENKFYKKKNMIITSSIEDYLKKEKIDIVYEKENININSIKTCEIIIKEILKGNYNAVGIEQIKEIIEKIKNK